MLAPADTIQPIEVDTVSWHAHDLPAGARSVGEEADCSPVSGVVSGESSLIDEVEMHVETAHGERAPWRSAR